MPKFVYRLDRNGKKAWSAYVSYQTDSLSENSIIDNGARHYKEKLLLIQVKSLNLLCNGVMCFCINLVPSHGLKLLKMYTT